MTPKKLKTYAHVLVVIMVFTLGFEQNMTYRSKVRTCLWFEKSGLEAAEFYVSLLPFSAIDAVYEHGSKDDPLAVEYTLHGAPMMHLTAGPYFQLSPAASISVLTKDQDETDHLWSSLISGGGSESQCGWLIDKYGVSWQIIPEALPKLLGYKDQAAAKRARAAMMTMKKIDIMSLIKASEGI
jgi:predicted 3-demethylubiquinone-9 3-methyltransferase (glyoxalase superfamily)